MIRQGANRRSEASAHDHRRPAGLTKFGDGLLRRRLHRLQITATDRFHVLAPRPDDLESLAEDRFDRDAPFHRGIRHRFNRGEQFGTTPAREFVDAFDGTEGAVAVEQN